MDSPLSEPFSTRRMKMLSRPDGFMLYGKRKVDVFSTSELLYPNMKIGLRQVRATTIFYMISDKAQSHCWSGNCWLLHRHSSYCSQGWLSQQKNGHPCICSHGIQLLADFGIAVSPSCQTKPVYSGKYFWQGSSLSKTHYNEYKICIHWIVCWKFILVPKTRLQTNKNTQRRSRNRRLWCRW